MPRLSRMLGRLFVLVLLPVLTAAGGVAHAQDTATATAGETMYLDVEGKGRITIRLRPDLAPNHVARIKELADSGFYDGIIFHRVIEGFMAQTGDPTGTGMGGSGQKLAAEFNNAPFNRGTLGMARSSDPDSGDSQFFITFDSAPHLNGQYTVWGEVVEGMDVVDSITRGEPPANPDRIARFRTADAAQ